MNSYNRLIFSGLVGSLFLLGIIYYDWLFLNFWILAPVILWLLFILQIILIILNFKKNRKALIYTLITCTVGLAIYVYRYTETFKSEILLSAYLADDLSAIELKLRADNSFELIPITYLGAFEKFTGNYQIIGNKIVFQDRPYSNEFIHDTVYLVENKIVVDFNLDGQPDTSFANFFSIGKNELTETSSEN